MSRYAAPRDYDSPSLAPRASFDPPPARRLLRRLRKTTCLGGTRTGSRGDERDRRSRQVDPPRTVTSINVFSDSRPQTDRPRSLTDALVTLGDSRAIRDGRRMLDRIALV